MRLEHGDRVVVCDAGKYLALENQGDRDRIDLRVLSHRNHPQASTRQLGDDRPGRFPTPAGQRSSVEQTDWHELGEERFIDSLIAEMETWLADDNFRHVVIVADVRSVGRLRAGLTPRLAKHVSEIIPGDFAHRPIPVIEKLIASV